jgi:hypothetical protein
MRHAVSWVPLLACVACQLVNTGPGQELACATQSDCASGLLCSREGLCLDPCLDYATTECGLLQSCTGGFAVTLDYGDLSTCVDRLQLHCQDFIAAPDTTTTLAQVGLCALDLPNATCAEFWSDGTAACQAPNGTAANGSDCAVSGQCQSGFCAIPSGQVCGSCADEPSAGTDCSSVPCSDGTICLSASKTCSLPIQDGGPCTDQDDCVLGFQCLGVAKNDAGFCAPGAASGTPCDPAKLEGPVGCDGREGVYCRGVSDGGGVCTPFAFAGPGQPCGDVPGGVFTECSRAGVCVEPDGGPRPSGAAGVCVGVAQDGAACDDATGPACLDPAVCVSGTCVRDDSESCGVVASADGGS